MTDRDVLDELIDTNVKKVKVAVTDIDGYLRGKLIHIDKFQSALEKGFGFCNVVFGWDSSDTCYDKCEYTGWHTGYPDALVKLDLNTLRRIPWDNGQVFVLGDFIESESKAPLGICPRNILKKVIDRAKKIGFNPLCGCEFEWFNFKETPNSLYDKQHVDPLPLTPGMFGYSLLRMSSNQEYFNNIMDMNEDFNIPIEGLHTETGPGVFEAAIKFSDALEAADRAQLFKSAVKEIGKIHDITASFMARWNTEFPGCSGHIHQSLVDENGANLFYDVAAKHQMSQIFSQYIAGLVHCTPEFLLMMAPTVNSYKRLVKGFWAPTSATWGIDNRTCAFRVISGGSSSTRVEVRVPGADMNPYLSLAASIAAGLYGIENNLSLEQNPIKGNGYDDQLAQTFPDFLPQATQRFAESEIAKEYFGEEFVNHYALTRRWEWQQAKEAVTDWELKRYFEGI